MSKTSLPSFSTFIERLPDKDDYPSYSSQLLSGGDLPSFKELLQYSQLDHHARAQQPQQSQRLLDWRPLFLSGLRLTGPTLPYEHFVAFYQMVTRKLAIPCHAPFVFFDQFSGIPHALDLCWLDKACTQFVVCSERTRTLLDSCHGKGELAVVLVAAEGGSHPHLVGRYLGLSYLQYTSKPTSVRIRRDAARRLAIKGPTVITVPETLQELRAAANSASDRCQINVLTGTVKYVGYQEQLVKDMTGWSKATERERVALESLMAMK